MRYDSEHIGRLTALITGASSGIGLEFSRRLAELGHDLVMVSNQDEELKKYASEIAEKFGVKTTTLSIDLTQKDAALTVKNFLIENKTDVDVLINNAGIFSFNPVLDTPIGKISCFLELHNRAVTELCYHIGTMMRERKSGYILNMSSMSCWMPMPGIAMYSATKAYIRAFSRALNYELRDYGVSVTTACPGGIATDLFGLPDNLKRLAVNLGVLYTPEKFTRKAIGKMFRKKKQYINGFINRISIVFVAMMPTSVRMMIKHKMLDKNIRKP